MVRLIILPMPDAENHRVDRWRPRLDKGLDTDAGDTNGTPCSGRLLSGLTGEEARCSRQIATDFRAPDSSDVAGYIPKCATN